MFYSFPHDTETALIKGMNAIYALAQIGQRSTNDAGNNNYTVLNATANECMPTQCEKRGENTEGKAKSNEVWRKPTKCVPMACFYKQKHNKDRKNKNNNINNNRHNVLINYIEIESENEVDVVQIITKENAIKWEKHPIKNDKREKF